MKRMVGLWAVLCVAACGGDEGGDGGGPVDITMSFNNVEQISSYAANKDPRFELWWTYSVDTLNRPDGFDGAIVDVYLTEDAEKGGPMHFSTPLGAVAGGVSELGFPAEPVVFKYADIPELPEGTITSRVEVTLPDGVTDSAPENDTGENTLEVGYPDLTIAIDSVAGAGGTLTMTFTATNEGTGDAGAFTIDIWDDLSNGPAPSAGPSQGDRREFFDALAAGASETRQLSFPSNCNCQSGTSWVTIDEADANENYIGQATGQVYETNESNNFDSAAW